jgi:hypothetical protein
MYILSGIRIIATNFALQNTSIATKCTFDLPSSATKIDIARSILQRKSDSIARPSIRLCNPPPSARMKEGAPPHVRSAFIAPFQAAEKYGRV